MIPYDIVRKSIESMYEGVCTIIEYRGIKDPIKKTTKHEEVIVLENQPCRLSFKTSNPSNNEETHNSALQVIKLFLAPEIKIKEGSKIRVSQSGVTKDYKSSGIPQVNLTHQEVLLEDFKGWI